jgi:FkbM family methyltransferase
MLISFKNVLDRHNINPLGVIHVGAHWGQEAKYYYGNGVKKTVWIEADPNCIDKLRQEVSIYKDALVLNECVSDVDGKEVVFNISSNDGQSSSYLEFGYHKIAHPEVNYVSSINLKTKTLNTIFIENKINIKDYNFLTADIQGAELLLLKGSTDILDDIDCVYAEINDKEVYKNCGLVGEIDEFLKIYGFDRVETQMCGYTGWGDAVYCKVR